MDAELNDIVNRIKNNDPTLETLTINYTIGTHIILEIMMNAIRYNNVITEININYICLNNACISHLQIPLNSIVT